MKACGVIVEYNPFHKGHIYHLEEARRISGCDIIVGVMSNGFVQRGDFAVCSALERAKVVLECGVDILVELPYPYTLQNADKFAIGAINVLQYLKVDSLCFGSESNDLKALYASIDTQTILLKDKDKSKSLNRYNSELKSNDILGIAYLKALKQTSITPFSIKRTNDYHDIDLSVISSASAIRKAFEDNIDVEAHTPLAKHLTKLSIKDYYPTIRHLLLTLDDIYLSELCMMSEGIENLLKKNAQLYSDFDAFLSACTSKKYTTSRLRRILCHLLLSTTKKKQEALEKLNVIRLLGINSQGQKYIKQNKLKLCTNFSKLPPLYKEYLNKYMHLSQQDTELKLPYIKKIPRG